MDLPQKHRDGQPFARGLARQELALALWQMPACPIMLRGTAVECAATAPWMAVFPGRALSLGVCTFHLFGDALDPTLWVLEERAPVVLSPPG